MDSEIVKSHLLDAGYKNNCVTDNTVNRLLSLSGLAYKMLYDWIYKSVSPSFNPIHGVGSDFLVERLHMKAPALIIAYSMLEENPEENAVYFKKLADNIVGFYPNLKS